MSAGLAWTALHVCGLLIMHRSLGDSEPLRTHYTHEIPLRGEHEGREVGGEQRLSIMLRVSLTARARPTQLLTLELSCTGPVTYSGSRLCEQA